MDHRPGASGDDSRSHSLGRVGGAFNAVFDRGGRAGQLMF